MKDSPHRPPSVLVTMVTTLVFRLGTFQAARCILVLALLFEWGGMQAGAQSQVASIDALRLTDEETAWLETISEVEVYLASDYGPFSLRAEDGSFVGIFPDTLDAIGQRLGIRFRYLETSRRDLNDQVASGGGALIGPWSLQETTLGSPFQVSRAFSEDHISVFGRVLDTPIDDLRTIEGKRVALLEGSEQQLISELLDRNQPIWSQEIGELVPALMSGRADYIIGSLEAIRFDLRQTDVESVRELYTLAQPSGLGVLVPAGEAQLLALIDKALSAFQSQALLEIQDQWIKGRSASGPRLDSALREWLTVHPEITLGAVLVPPYLWRRSDGTLAGRAVTRHRVLEEWLGFNIELRIVPSFGEAKRLTELGELDGYYLNLGGETSDSRFLTSARIFDTKIYGTTRIDAGLEVATLGDLEGERVGYRKRFGFIKAALEPYPRISAVPLEDNVDPLRMVLNGEVNATLHPQRPRIEARASADLLRTRILAGTRTNVTYAIRQDWPELVEILNEGLSAIDGTGRSTGAGDPTSVALELTELERQWIREHPEILIGTADFPPLFDQRPDGTISGGGGWLHELICDRLGIQILLEAVGPWPNTVEEARSGRLDGLFPSVGIESRKEQFLFSDPLFVVQTYVSTRRNAALSADRWDQLEGKRVGYWSHLSYLERDLAIRPKIVGVPFANLESLVRGLLDGQVDAVVNHHDLRDTGLPGASLLENRTLRDSETEVVYSVRKDWPELVGLLNKGIHSLSLGDRLSAFSQGGSVSHVVTTRPSSLFQTRTMVAIGQGGIVLALFCGMGFAIARLLKLTGTDASSTDLYSPRFARTVVVFNALLVSVVFVGSWISLLKIKQRVMRDMRDSLQTVLETSVESLDDWVRNEQNEPTRTASHPELLASIEDLLRVSTGEEPVGESASLGQLRAFFQDREDTYGTFDFFVVSPEGINIAAMRDANLGRENLIKAARPDLFRRVLDGESLLVPPMLSDAPLANVPTVHGSEGQATMFIAVPVVDSDGVTTAVLTRRVNPHAEMSSILQRGRIGATGETYAFDRHGVMCSGSRFPDHLVKCGLLSDGAHEILSIRVCDPGRNLTESDPLVTGTDEMPLTEMVQSALEGEAGSNVAGYRD